MVLSFRDNILNYDNMELQIIHFYETATRFLDSETNVITIELLQFLLNKVGKLLRYSIFVAVENALFNTNRFSKRIEFIKSLEISPEIHKKYGATYEKIMNKSALNKNKYNKKFEFYQLCLLIK
jgi:hypothetical protein